MIWQQGLTSPQHSAVLTTLRNWLVLLLNPTTFPAVTEKIDFGDWQTIKRCRAETVHIIEDTFSAANLLLSFNPFGFWGLISKSIESVSNTINHIPETGPSNQRARLTLSSTNLCYSLWWHPRLVVENAPKVISVWEDVGLPGEISPSRIHWKQHKT